MDHIEYERRFLAKEVPSDIDTVESVEICDKYIPATQAHPNLRLRKNGYRYEMTKKFKINPGDNSTLKEMNIELSKEEFDALYKIDGKELIKNRYKYPYKGNILEINVFHGDLEGLIMIEVEFQDRKDLDKFVMPNYCFAEVTQVEYFAGGILAGKCLADIENDLKEFGIAPNHR